MNENRQFWPKMLPSFVAKILIILHSLNSIWASRLLAVRPTRQLEEPLAGLPSKQIDLNITVPFVFSARLYPFGTKNGDMELAAGQETLEFKPTLPILFYGQSFDKIWIHKNGFIAFSPPANGELPPSNGLPIEDGPPLIAPFWTNGRRMGKMRRRVFVRETNDENTLALAQNEVNIQFRYGNGFEPETVIVITWEEREEEGKQTNPLALFQLAILSSRNACFAHAVYSKLPSESAIVGFNGPPISREIEEEDEGEEEEGEKEEDAASANRQPHFTFPGSGTADAGREMAEKSNIGIPGEWLLRVDGERLFLCSAGFQGLECVDSCQPHQWFLDCSRQCHCADGLACNVETGECPDAKCSPGWQGAPICDEDIDECAAQEAAATTSKICPEEQPDCMNTPGSFLCFCIDYDNSTGNCAGLSSSSSREKPSAESTASQPAERILVPVPSLSLIPQLGPSASGRNRPSPLLLGGGGAKLDAPNRPSPTAAQPITIRPIFGNPLQSPPPPRRPSIAAPNPPPFPPLANPQNENEAAVESEEIGGNGEERAEECGGQCGQNAQCLEGKCQCADGWMGTGRGNGQECVDVDECTVNATICGQNAECRNLVGTYQCICNAGFIAAQNGLGCLDVDECSQPDPVCPQQNALCVNTVGGFQCQCLPGFVGDPNAEGNGGGGCVDVDECQLGEYYCGGHANCTNLLGSFRCDCHPGFEPIPSSPLQCRDIDECALRPNPCHRAAICTNLEGAFHCQCLEGFIGDGRHQCQESVLFPVPISQIRPKIAAPVPLGPIHVDLIDHPLILFGHPFSSISISPQGFVLPGTPLNQSHQFSSPPANSLVPLMANYDLGGAREGPSIGAFQADEDEDDNNRGWLSRATMLVQNDFRVANFRAKRLFIAHFEGMTEAKGQSGMPPKRDTFQLALVQGSQHPTGHPHSQQSTFAIFLYNELEWINHQAMAGIAHPTLGFHSIPVEFLLNKSNVGQPGKWIFRVDLADKLFACPSGTFGPPLCQQECDPGQWGFDCAERCNCAGNLPCDFGSGQCPGGKCAPGFTGQNCAEDVDECRLGTHRCAPQASCTNSIGAYNCKCKSGFYGDGFNCTEIDPCLVRFGTKCHGKAHCDASNEEMPECICSDGFHGDGRRDCRPNVLTTTTKTSMTTTMTEGKKSSANFAAFTANLVTNSPSKTTKTIVKEHSTKRPPMLNEKTANFNDIEEKRRSTMGPKDAEESSSTVSDSELISAVTNSGTFILIVCSILGATWLIVALLFTLIYCFRKRRRTRQSEYSPQMLGWAPTRTLNLNTAAMGLGAGTIGPKISTTIGPTHLARTKFTIS